MIMEVVMSKRVIPESTQCPVRMSVHSRDDTL